MDSIEQQITALINHRNAAAVQVQTLGVFQVWCDGELIPTKNWGREATLQLFQYLVTSRHRGSLRKEQIIDRIWEDLDGKAGARNFKVALHGLNKALEPNRPTRTEPKYIFRQGVTYQLNLSDIWIDVDAVENFIALGNQALATHPELAERAYREALALHQGGYLPNRLYEDWSSEERENIQVLTLGAMVTLGELLLVANPMESIRLSQQALQIDHTWEDAYRVQMAAYFQKGNRPQAIKTYQKCKAILEEEFGIDPLPETKKLLERIKSE